MSITYVNLEDEYKVQTDNEDISISVAIGDGQSGAYVIFLGKELKGTNALASLGKKQNVVGENALIAVTIADTLEQTNWTSIAVNIKEGEISTPYGPYKKQAPQHLDTVIYTLKIHFA